MTRATTETESVPIEEVRRICGDIADWKAASIVALHPSAADLNAAVAEAELRDEFRQKPPAASIVAQVCDILMADEDADEER